MNGVYLLFINVFGLMIMVSGMLIIIGSPIKELNSFLIGGSMLIGGGLIIYEFTKSKYLEVLE